MSTTNKFQLIKILFYVASILIMFNLMSSEYTNWVQKLNCQEKCAIQGFKNCTYTPENFNKGQSERCVCGTQNDHYLVLN